MLLWQHWRGLWQKACYRSPKRTTGGLANLRRRWRSHADKPVLQLPVFHHMEHGTWQTCYSLRQSRLVRCSSFASELHLLLGLNERGWWREQSKPSMLNRASFSHKSQALWSTARETSTMITGTSLSLIEWGSCTYMTIRSLKYLWKRRNVGPCWLRSQLWWIFVLSLQCTRG